MIAIIVALVALVLSATGIIVRKTVFSVPLLEQKRRAQHGNDRTKALYRLAAYGDTARVFFWAWISISAAISLVLLARAFNPWISACLVAVLIWFSFAWLPKGTGNTFGLRITMALAPLIARLLNLLYRPLHASSKVVAKRYSAQAHTGIYERADLERLLDAIQQQEDSRMSEQEIEIIRRVLDFQNLTIADCMVPVAKLLTVYEHDTVGPVLINEIHAHNQPYVIVKESKKGPIVGLLAFDGLDLHSTGEVAKYMATEVQFMHEKDSLTQALTAFKEVNGTVFMVVDSSADIVGMLTLHDMLVALFGHVPGDGFDEFSDPIEVSKRHLPPEERKKPVVEFEEVVE